MVIILKGTHTAYDLETTWKIIMSDLKNYCLTCYCQNDQPKIVYMYSEKPSSRWQEENNRLLFSITGIDDLIKAIINLYEKEIPNCLLYLNYIERSP